MKRAALWLIHQYQQRVSGGLPPSCRFAPSCSQYAYEAIEEYGTLRGGLMMIWRLLRCNPLNDGGYDPVPERRPAEQSHA